MQHASENSLKLGLISDNYPYAGGSGGIGSYTCAVAEYLALCGHEVHVFTMAQEPGTLTRNRVRIWKCPSWSGRRSLPLRTAIQYTIRYGRQPRYLNRVAISQAVTRASKDRPFDVLESPEFGALGDLVSPSCYRRLSVRLHGPATQVVEQAPWHVSDSPERALALRADRVTVGSYSARAAISSHWGVDLSHVKVIRNPIPRSMASRIPSEQDPARIVCFGRFDERKGLPVLIRALGLLMGKGIRCKVTLVGNDTYSKGGSAYSRILLQLAQELGVADSVTIASPLYGRELTECVTEHMVAVFPSRIETSPIAIMEALSWGIPVVSSDILPFLELREETYAFPVFLDGSPSSLADSLASVIEAFQAALAAAQEGRERADRWSVNDVTQELLSYWLKA